MSGILLNGKSSSKSPTGSSDIPTNIQNNRDLCNRHENIRFHFETARSSDQIQVLTIQLQIYLLSNPTTSRGTATGMLT